MKLFLLLLIPCVSFANSAKDTQKNELYWTEYAHDRTKVSRVGLAEGEYRVSFSKDGKTVITFPGAEACSNKSGEPDEDQGSWVIVDTGDVELDERLWLLAALAKKEDDEVRAFIDVDDRHKHPHGWCKLVRLHWLD